MSNMEDIISVLPHAEEIKKIQDEITNEKTNLIKTLARDFENEYCKRIVSAIKEGLEQFKKNPEQNEVTLKFIKDLIITNEKYTAQINFKFIHNPRLYEDKIYSVSFLHFKPIKYNNFILDVHDVNNRTFLFNNSFEVIKKKLEKRGYFLIDISDYYDYRYGNIKIILSLKNPNINTNSSSDFVLGKRTLSDSENSENSEYFEDSEYLDD